MLPVAKNTIKNSDKNAVMRYVIIRFVDDFILIKKDK